MSTTSLSNHCDATHHLPLDWLEPKFVDGHDDPQDEVVLPSFVDLQRKTLATLYGRDEDSAAVTPQALPDKSPKGSVDAPIRPLVDLINRHSHYTTLSSCSGRISLFDPTRSSSTTSTTTTDDDAGEEQPHTSFTEQSGKGRGTWRLVSHDTIEVSELLDCLAHHLRQVVDDDDDDCQHSGSIPWSLQFEPMLLHVAASSVERGQQLLQIALGLGFRESGLIVTSKRVTVAIRSHSLAMNVPIPSMAPKNKDDDDDDGLPLPKDYLMFLVKHANDKILLNWQRLDSLYDKLEQEFFQIIATRIPATMSCVAELPPLHLWSAATIIWKKNAHEQYLYTFGGYGVGIPKPDHPKQGSRRLSCIHRLRLTTNKRSDDNGSLPTFDIGPWEVVNLSSQDDLPNNPWKHLAAERCHSLPAAQGMGATTIRLLADPHVHSTTGIVLWGGRASPTQPLPSDTLYFVDPVGCVLMKIRIRGQPPSPRWGHGFIAIGERCSAVVGGNNDEEGAMDDIHLLHYDPDGYFYWERIETRLPNRRFHHACVVQRQAGDGTSILWVLGGETVSSRKVLQAFESDTSQCRLPNWSCRIETKVGNSSKTPFHSCCTPLDLINTALVPQGCGAMGLATCNLLDGHCSIISGGVNAIHPDSAPIEAAVFQRQTKTSTTSITGIPLRIEQGTNPLLLGSLVHHACEAISNDHFVLVGGGVKSFAFGDTFAKSYLVKIKMPTASGADQRSYSGIRPNTLATPLSSTPQTSQRPHDSTEMAQNMVPAILVSPQVAKQVKRELESLGWLDRGFRMNKIETEEDDNYRIAIAIPVTKAACLSLQRHTQQVKQPKEGEDGATEDWKSLILEFRRSMELPYSTARYAARSSRKK